MAARMIGSIVFGINRIREYGRKKTIGSPIYPLLKTASRLFARVMPDYQRWVTRSIFYRDDQMWMCSLFPQKILDWIVANLQPDSLLDIGSGTGRSVEYLIEHGVDAWGVEGSSLAICKAKYPERIIRWNLEKELRLKRRFDVIFSYEVLEHIHPDCVDNLVRTFANHGDVLVVTAAPPGQGGDGHFNEQPAEYWIDQFRHYSYVLDSTMTTSIRSTGEQYCENALVFRREKGICRS